jgi:hypothetical protein
MKITVFWGTVQVAWYKYIDISKVLAAFIIRAIEAECASEMLSNFEQNTWYNIRGH